MEGMDPKLAAAVVGYLPRAMGVAKKAFTAIDDALSYSIRQAHFDYAAAVVKKHSKAKTFLIRTEAVDLYDFYVPASVNVKGRSRVDRVDLNKLRTIDSRLIITGSGGSGKTILLRHLLLDSLLSGTAFPLLVELRNLNDSSNKSLRSEIVDNLRANGFGLSEDYINRSLAEGLFVLLLDGFDEIQFTQRKALELEIRKLATSTSCQIVITSRPDSNLQSWEKFTNVEISNLTLDEACELVEKVKFDDDIKMRFVKSLRSGIFATHEFFLSNPLLLSIMLLTYGDSADIPKRLSSFYMQAYEALFQQHDALKASFRRERKTDLDIYEFARLFSGFSVVSYDARAFRFSRTDGIAFVRKAAEITGVTRASSDGFLDDAKQSVCLLLEDGLELAFAHRSFQEYFAARFIAESNEILQKKLIEKITSGRSSTLRSDNVIGLLHEMDPMLVEKFYLIPKLSVFFGKAANRKVSKIFWLSAFLKCFDMISMNRDDRRVWWHVSTRNDATHDLIGFVVSRYMPEMIGLDADLWRAKSEAFSRKYFSGNEFQLPLKDVTVRSRFIDDLGELHKYWNVAGLEKIRLCLRDMKARAASRADAIDRIF